MYIASWNKKYPENKLYTNTNSTGYYVGTSENPTSHTVDMMSTPGFQDELYYPHRETWNSCYGYFLASPSVHGNNHEMYVSSVGAIGLINYYDRFCGVRPLVHLRSNVRIKPQGENFVLE